MKHTLRILFFTLAASSASNAQVNLITNGGFENPAVLPASSQLYSAPGAGPAFWTIGGPTSQSAVISSGANPWRLTAPYDSNYYAMGINGSATGGTIQQAFSTIPGREYIVNFTNGRAIGNNQPRPLSVVPPGTASGTSLVFDTTSLLTLGNSGTFSVTGDGFFTGASVIRNFYTFTATSSSSTLRFTNTTPTAEPLTDLALDDVLVFELPVIPEPSSASLIAAFAVLSAFKRSRRRNG